MTGEELAQRMVEMAHHRNFATEKRAGVEHLVTGQLRAQRFEAGDEEGPLAGVLLAWTPPDGHRVVVIGVLRDDTPGELDSSDRGEPEWVPDHSALIGRSWGMARDMLPADFTLSPRMLEAVEAAWTHPSGSVVAMGPA